MIRLPDYPKPQAEYKPEAQLILGKPCYVQEKIDGSQFSFSYLEGQFCARSRGQMIDPEAPANLFSAAVANARALCESGKLPPDLIYRGEALCKPKHNTLLYGRAPENNFILFDVQDIKGNFWAPEQLDSLGVEHVGTEATNLVFTTRQAIVDWAAERAEKQSRLGGAIEGFVFKEHSASPDRAVVKVVREQFKELHAGNPDWERTGNKTGLDKVLQQLSGPARYVKALSHLKDAGLCQNSMRDMPGLMKEFHSDLDSDNQAIRDLLWAVFGKEIKRQLGGGLALWYKDILRNDAG